jgi:hypothetical protein
MRLWLATLAIGAASCAAGSALAAETPAGESTGELSRTIPRWVAELDSDRFVIRETATQKLIEAGLPAIEPLARVLPDASLEAVTRGIYVLRELAISGDEATENAARAALEGIAEAKVTAAARRAATTLAQLDELRQERALAELERLGAIVSIGHVQVGFQFVEGVSSVEIGDEWKGTERDLAHLRWLGDVQRIVFRGPRVTDGWLAHVGHMKGLGIVEIKHASITDAGVVPLVKLENVQQVSIFYSPITDGAIEHLVRLRNPTVLKIYGTRISPEGADRLARTLAATSVDFKRGGFLGVGCDPQVDRCFVTHVQPESAAARAGLLAGDFILRYDGKPLAGFESLRDLIKNNQPGDRVPLVILRDGETLEKMAVLGEWE